MTVQLTFQQGVFYAKVGPLDLEERKIVKGAGFFWNDSFKLWYTRDVANAARLRQFGDRRAREELDRLLINTRPWTGRIPFPKGLTPRPFQIERAVPWALSRNRSYLGLDPGLGKTICAALTINALDAAAVYVCPPFLVPNVEAEMRKWVVGRPHIRRFSEELPLFGSGRILIVPDSALYVPRPPKPKRGNPVTALALQAYQRALEKWISLRVAVTELIKAHAGREVVLFVDEAHRYKNPSTGRTKALFQYFIRPFKRIVYMSGTPMPNGRPHELWPILSHSAPEAYGHLRFHDFAVKYCNAFEGPYGWDYSGASNVPELMERVKEKFMLRLTKDEVLDELPPKTESIVVLDERLPPKLSDFEFRELKDISKCLAKKGGAIETPHISTHLMEVGIAKASLVARAIKDRLTDSGEAILLFARHREVLAILAKELRGFNPIVIDGSTPPAQRFRLAKLFQEDSKRRLAILQIVAAGIGLNLTRATRVGMAESSWVPGENDQCADRAHRIGQKDHVLVEHYVFADSIEAKVLEANLRKRKVTRHV